MASAAFVVAATLAFVLSIMMHLQHNMSQGIPLTPMGVLASRLMKQYPVALSKTSTTERKTRTVIGELAHRLMKSEGLPASVLRSRPSNTHRTEVPPNRLDKPDETNVVSQSRVMPQVRRGT